MRAGVTRIAVIALASLPWLVACETTETTGSIGAPGKAVTAKASPAASSEEASDDLRQAKVHYRENRFDRAEQHFIRAAESKPNNPEAWVGLAATYDKLQLFERADRAYERALKLAGPTAEILNNQGYSYMLRGDRQRARQTLLTAQGKDPDNPYIKNNLALLEGSSGSTLQ